MDEQHSDGSVDRRALLGISAGLIGVAALAHKATAGPLSPPAGPIGSTGRTLAEIEPRTPVHSLSGDTANVHVITQSGNYCLTSDIIRTAGKTAIRIAADFVTLDLNGFSMIGNRGSSGGIESAIEISSSRTGVVVRNGTVRGWPFYGLIGYGQRCRFENLLIDDNHAGGLEVFAPFSLVHRCIVQNSAELSIGAGHGAVITECVVFGGNVGITTGEASVVRDCTVHNAGTAIEVGSGVVERCTVRCISIAGSRGIVATQSARIEGNTVVGCSDTGIKAQFGSSVANNVIQQCGIGIDAVGGGAVGSVGNTINRVQGNTLSANTTGIRALNGGSMVVGNAVSGSGAQAYNLVEGNPSGAIRNSPAAATSPLDNFAF
ncbi:MAG: hypothetical protein QM783_02250 [Phycisphaerales bacterium]